MVVYKITNKINGNVYVGQTIQPVQKRWHQHKYNKDGRSTSLIHLAIKKYGKEAFSFEVIGNYASIEELNLAEEYFISWHNCQVPNGYNLDSGGYNKFMHQSTKIKLSLARRGKPNLNGRGRPAWNKGMHGVQAYRRGPAHPDYGRSKPGRPVLCVTTGITYCHAKDAGLRLGIDNSGIAKVCNGKRKTIGGYTFVYSKEHV